MKKLTDVIIGDKSQVAIIDYYTTPERNTDGSTHWVNEKEGIAFLKGDPFSVTIYVQDKSDYDKLNAVEIRASSIKKLMNLFKEIESELSQGFID